MEIDGLVTWHGVARRERGAPRAKSRLMRWWMGVVVVSVLAVAGSLEAQAAAMGSSGEAQDDWERPPDPHEAPPPSRLGRGLVAFGGGLLLGTYLPNVLGSALSGFR